VCPAVLVLQLHGHHAMQLHCLQHINHWLHPTSALRFVCAAQHIVWQRGSPVPEEVLSATIEHLKEAGAFVSGSANSQAAWCLQLRLSQAQWILPGCLVRGMPCKDFCLIGSGGAITSHNSSLLEHTCLQQWA
jgi:hypothetical protein